MFTDILGGCQPGTVYVRRVSCERDHSFYEKLDNIHKTIHNRPYDMNIWDWLKAYYYSTYSTSIEPSSSATTSRFWCSALVAYIFEKMDLIDPVDWTIITPKDFSSSTRIHFRCAIGNEELLK